MRDIDLMALEASEMPVQIKLKSIEVQPCFTFDSTKEYIDVTAVEI